MKRKHYSSTKVELEKYIESIYYLLSIEEDKEAKEDLYLFLSFIQNKYKELYNVYYEKIN